jgi:hypothetical protein
MANKRKLQSSLPGLPPAVARRQFLAGVRITFVGVGSLARPLAELAVRFGASDFVLIDSKSYKPASVHNQCSADEVGLLKVLAVQRRLERLGARAEAYPQDVFQVPDGVADAKGVVVSTVDNWRGFIGANRLAMRMHARLLKLNVEPKLHCAAVRTYRLGPTTSLCGEDQMDDRHYRDQLHPRSCDAETAERRTASPRRLCEAAARLGIVALHRMVTRRPQHWHGRQWQYFQDAGRLLPSRLAPNPACRCDHSAVWQNLARPSHAAPNLSLRGIFQRGHMPVTGESRVRFCQRVALRSRCGRCLQESNRPYWINDVDAAAAACTRCGETMQAIPFWTFQELTCDQLAAVINVPLHAWGVPPLAVLEVSSRSRRQAFVVPADYHSSSKGASA